MNSCCGDESVLNAAISDVISLNVEYLSKLIHIIGKTNVCYVVIIVLFTFVIHVFWKRRRV